MASMYVSRSTVLALAFASTLAVQFSRAADPSPADDHAVVEALLRLPKGTLLEHPSRRPAVMRYLSKQVGSPKYMVVARQLGVTGNTDQLITMLTAVPFDTLAVDAARLLIKAERFDAIHAALHHEESDRAAVVATVLGHVWHPQTFKILKEVVNDDAKIRQIRVAAVGALGRSQPGLEFLLELAKTDRLQDDIRFTASDLLLGAKDRAIKIEAAKYLSTTAALASESIPPINQLVKKKGNGTRGKQVFETVGTCIKCHKVNGAGKEIGPDLSEIGSKLSRHDMFVAILNPSAAISHNYEMYTLLDIDGKVVSGLLMNQTDSLTTIRTSEGVDHTLATDDIESIKKQTVSLMPADLQKAMSLQNLVDVVDYMTLLRSERDARFQVLQGSGDAEVDQHDPNVAIGGFEVAGGIEVDLFASEPQLLSPTSIDIDHLGRVWVCEAVNYRHFRNPDNVQRTEGDRILVLEDTDGDGAADRRTVFYQGSDIDSPHGICVLGDQIIVSAGENVFVFTDEDGDLKADSKRVLFSGIGGVQHDHGIHAFGVGPDGKLYFNFGNAGGQLRSPGGETIVDKSGNVVSSGRNPYQQGMVFRCNLDGSDLETLGWNFRNNWEVCVDSFGTMWQSDNDDDGNRGARINFVMEFGNYGYRDELTGASWQTSRIGLEREIPLQHWHLNDPGVVPNILQTGAGSPTGICFYEGTLLPPQFQNQIIHTDPGPSVVRAYPVQQDGAGYKATIRNLVRGVRDPWFRPVDVCAAPDGSLFVADWYDPGVGGHRMGDAKHGRIFRIKPDGHDGYNCPTVNLETAEGTVEALQSPNLATRYLAHQALRRLGTSAISALAELAKNGPSEQMQARAYWQLGLVSGDPGAWVKTAIQSSSADIRIVGIRMARQHETDLLAVIDQLKNDPTPNVRRELAIALRGNPDPRVPQLWVDLAMQHDGNDRWYLEALGIGAEGQWEPIFQAWLSRVGEDWNTPAGRDIIWRCRAPRACRYLTQLIQESESEEEQYRYFRAFDFHEGPAKVAALESLVTAVQ